VNLPDLLSRLSLQSPQQLVAKASNHLPLWVSLVFVILIGYYLAKIAWLLYPSTDASLWSPPPVPFATSDSSATPGGQNYQAIVDSHLFGTADTIIITPVVVEQPDDAPDTQLNLKLHATVSADNQTIAHAIIADGSGKEKVYFVSDSIPGGAALHSVHFDRVILNRGGILEALRLPNNFRDTASSGVRRSRPNRAAKSGSIQSMIASNVTKFTEIIRPQPFMPNGQLKGYRVFPGRNRQQFLALGLKPGDLVTKINGVTLNNPAQGMQIFNSLSNSTQVTITVDRNGQQQDISLNLDKLAEISNTKQ
jgi:general secretion pathway protein C